MALIEGKDFHRDGRGVSDLEMEVKHAIRRGESHISIEIAKFLIDELLDMRGQLHESDAYRAAIKSQRKESEELESLLELKRKAFLR